MAIVVPPILTAAETDPAAVVSFRRRHTVGMSPAYLADLGELAGRLYATVLEVTTDLGVGYSVSADLDSKAPLSEKIAYISSDDAKASSGLRRIEADTNLLRAAAVNGIGKVFGARAARTANFALYWGSDERTESTSPRFVAAHIDDKSALCETVKAVCGFPRQTVHITTDKPVAANVSMRNALFLNDSTAHLPQILGVPHVASVFPEGSLTAFSQNSGIHQMPEGDGLRLRLSAVFSVAGQ